MNFLHYLRDFFCVNITSIFVGVFDSIFMFQFDSTFAGQFDSIFRKRVKVAQCK